MVSLKKEKKQQQVGAREVNYGEVILQEITKYKQTEETHFKTGQEISSYFTVYIQNPQSKDSKQQFKQKLSYLIKAFQAQKEIYILG